VSDVPWWVYLVGVAGGVASIALGMGWKLGLLPTRKRRASWYFEVYTNEAMLKSTRWFMYGAIPFGVAWLSFFVAGVFASSTVVLLVGVLVALLMSAVGLVFVYERPRLLKPKWLVDVEEGRTRLQLDRPLGAPAWLLRLQWFSFIIGAAIAGYYGQYFIVAACFSGMALLAGMYVRRERSSFSTPFRRGGGAVSTQTSSPGHQRLPSGQHERPTPRSPRGEER
jgi:hypothetical protein